MQHTDTAPKAIIRLQKSLLYAAVGIAIGIFMFLSGPYTKWGHLVMALMLTTVPFTVILVPNLPNEEMSKAYLSLPERKRPSYRWFAFLIYICHPYILMFLTASTAFVLSVIISVGPSHMFERSNVILPDCQRESCKH